MKRRVKSLQGPVRCEVSTRWRGYHWSEALNPHLHFDGGFFPNFMHLLLRRCCRLSLHQLFALCFVHILAQTNQLERYERRSFQSSFEAIHTFVLQGSLVN